MLLQSKSTFTLPQKNRHLSIVHPPFQLSNITLHTNLSLHFWTDVQKIPPRIRLRNIENVRPRLCPHVPQDMGGKRHLPADPFRAVELPESSTHVRMQQFIQRTNFVPHIFDFRVEIWRFKWEIPVFRRVWIVCNNHEFICNEFKNKKNCTAVGFEPKHPDRKFLLQENMLVWI